MIEMGGLQRFSKRGKHTVMKPRYLPHPADVYDVELTYFTPAGTEQVTGLSTAMQRDWRKRGFLPQGDGHARFAIFDLCRLFLLKRLSDRGVGPDKASAVVDNAAFELALQVLAVTDAWGFDGYVPSWSIFRSELSRRAMEAHVQDLSNASSSVGLPKFVWWADDSCTLCESIDSALNEMLSDDPRSSGPIIILDLFALSSVIIDRMPTAFATARIVREEGQKTEVRYGTNVPFSIEIPTS